MDYRLNFYTKLEDFYQLEISFQDTDTVTYPLSLFVLHDDNGNKIFDHRRYAYQLILRSPIILDEDSLEKIYKEIRRTVKNIFEITPHYVDVVSLTQDKSTFSECFETFGRNILCSLYNNEDIQNVTSPDFITTNHIKRLNYDGPIVQLNPEQEVFRISDIRHKDVFPRIHCVLKEDTLHILENILDHKRNELTLYVIGDDYIALSPHVGFLQTVDNLFIWFVSSYILVPNLSERQRHFDPDIKHMTKINTTYLLERFQEVLKELNFVTINTIHNKSIYSFEGDTLVFIGEFPGDVVTTDIKEKFLSAIQNDSNMSD